MQTLPAPAQTVYSAIGTDTTIHRRKTRPVAVGSVIIGGNNPVVVQSMINEDTLDIAGAVAGIRRLHEIGCEIVRVTVPSMAQPWRKSNNNCSTPISPCPWLQMSITMG
jgi:(E)-4-hydroxy-3-methylbut-2-enyl-diphosphate synthase